MVKKTAQGAKKVVEQEIKLDLGCGPNKQEGFVGVDSRKFKGVDVVCDLSKGKWPWKDNTVSEVHCSHMIEHLNSEQRCHFMNELHRVLKPKAQAKIIAPYWSSGRAYGDPTHQWPPIAEWSVFYWNKEWRDKNAPHCNDLLNCDFDFTYVFSIHPGMVGRSADFQNFALAHYKEAAQDIVITLTKKE